MGKAEYIVIGAWAIQAKTGKIRHRPCRRRCSHYNEDNKPIHTCDFADLSKEFRDIPIPATVITVSECIRNKP